MIDELRAAADALNRGDPEPFLALIAEDSEWRGAAFGHLWWRRMPACHGPDEARAALQAGQRRRGGRPLAVNAEFTTVGTDRIIGSTSWTDDDGVRRERFQVLTVRGGKIVDMQGCTTRRTAERFARRRHGPPTGGAPAPDPAPGTQAAGEAGRR